ncbi:MAG: DMT family transporter, partial [Candidatus Micrarchaeota archaeon]
LVVGSGLVVGNLLFFKAIQIGNVSLVGPISELWSVFTVIAAALFLGEMLSSIQIVGVAIAFAGIFVVSKHSHFSKQLSSKSIHYALAAAVVWGCTWFLVKPLVDSAGVVGAFVLYEGVGTIVLLAWGLAKRELKPPDKILLKPALLQMVAYLFETWGILIATVSLVSVVFTPAYVLVLIPASAFFLKEKLEARHYAGIAMLLFGLILITLG